MRARGLFVSLILSACTPAGGENEAEATGVARDAVIYGEDDRVELFELTPDEPVYEIGTTAVAAMVKRSAIRSEGGHVWIDGPTWGEEQGLCPDVRFADQTVGAACTALAVTDDLVLTAGHCARLCSQTRFVFGWRHDAPGQLRTLTEADVYDCVDVVIDETDETGLDYAWLRLDRPRAAPTLTLRVDAPQPDEAVSLVSFPSGIPIKADRGGRITTTSDLVFTSSLDAFGGSSGGPVLDVDGAVLGILGGGAPDLTMTQDGCVVPVELAARGGVERATTIRAALEGLCTAEPASPLCDDGDDEDGEGADDAGCSVEPIVGREDPPGRAWPQWLFLGAIVVRRLQRKVDRGHPHP